MTSAVCPTIQFRYHLPRECQIPQAESSVLQDCFPCQLKVDICDSDQPAIDRSSNIISLSLTNSLERLTGLIEAFYLLDHYTIKE